MRLSELTGCVELKFKERHGFSQTLSNVLVKSSQFGFGDYRFITENLLQTGRVEFERQGH